MVVAGEAAAQRGGDVALDGFRPPMDTSGYVTVDGAATTPPGALAFGLYTTWTRGLLELDERYQVRDVLSPTLVASFGVPRTSLALGVSLPFGVVSGVRADGKLAAQGLGDVGLHAKLSLGRRAALAGSLWLPTATDDAWLGAGAVSGQLRAVVEGRRGRLRGALEAGVRLRAGGAAGFTMTSAGGEAMEVAAGAAAPVGGALAYELAPGKLDAVAEAWALVPLDGAGYAPVEALGGLKVHLAAASHLTLGGGVGVGPGGGNPDARAFLAIVFEPGRAAAARAVVPDVAAIEPPPPADSDRDGDTYVDRLDGCPDQPEDFDRLEDADGCPETDVDGDELTDELDLCAEDPENHNGNEDDDGCPDRDLVAFTGSTFDTLEAIHFEFDSAVIKPESYPVVRAVAAALRARPEVKHVEIGGHTDWQGSDAYNLRLSQARAEAVRAFLVDEGIEAARLEARGYGERRPLERGHTEAAAARNRRVEFVILP